MATSDDEDLKRAIAMSLSETESNRHNAAIVDITSDDEDEDMRRAIALSLQEGRTENAHADSIIGSSAGTRSSHPPQYASTTPDAHSDAQREIERSPSRTSGPVSFLNLNRRAMEQERLARLGKRKRSTSPERSSKVIAKEQVQKTASETKVETSGALSLEYPKGASKRTWANKHPRSNDITIEEVLQPSSTNIAVISSWQWDTDWVFSKIPPEETKQIWIMNAKGEELRRDQKREILEAGITNLKPHFPPMAGQVMSMHSKLMLLFHKEYLRIVIPTANMRKEYWGESNKDPATGKSWQPGVMENSVFLIDLPRRPGGEPLNEAGTTFGKELVYFLKAQEVGDNVIEGVLKFDFSETQRLAFVHSIGGNHSGAGRDRTGLPGLARAIRNLKLDQVAALELDYAVSSLGSLKEPFLKQIYLAASGLSPLSDADSGVLNHFRIYFPTKETVTKSTGGPDCGGIITLARSFYNSAAFPRQCLRDYKSTRGGLLSHNKLLFARGRKRDGSAFAWAYIGSANISESAWGSYKVLKSGKEGSLNIRNWESGVIVPVPNEMLKGLGLADGEVPPMSVFEGTIDVPFQYPGDKYDGREPWFSRG